MTTMLCVDDIAPIVQRVVERGAENEIYHCGDYHLCWEELIAEYAKAIGVDMPSKRYSVAGVVWKTPAASLYLSACALFTLRKLLPEREDAAEFWRIPVYRLEAGNRGLLRGLEKGAFAEFLISFVKCIKLWTDKSVQGENDGERNQDCVFRCQTL